MDENEQHDLTDLTSAVRESTLNSSANEITELDPQTAVRIADQKIDTVLRQLYARWFVGILITQLVLMNVIFLLVGFKVLSFDEPTHLNLFMGGTLAEVFGVVFVITRYLFPKR